MDSSFINIQESNKKDQNYLNMIFAMQLCMGEFNQNMHVKEKVTLQIILIYPLFVIIMLFNPF